MAKVSTKAMAEVLTNLKATSRVLVVTEGVNENVYLSSRNLDEVSVTPANLLCTYDVVGADNIVISKEALISVEEALK